jgi:hypothetical protein
VILAPTLSGDAARSALVPLLGLYVDGPGTDASQQQDVPLVEPALTLDGEGLRGRMKPCCK